MSSSKGRLSALIRERDGVFTVADAIAAGYSEGWARQQVRRGFLRRRGRGVFQCITHSETPRAALRAAVLTLDGIATGTSVGWWRGLTEQPDRWTVIVPPGRSGGEHRATTVRRRRVYDCDIEIVDGLRVTTLPLATLDALVEGERGVAMFDRSLARHATELDALVATHERYPRRWGAVEAARVLDLASDRTKGALERMFAKLLDDAGFTGWVAGHDAGYELDFAFPDAGVAIELDGFAFHTDVAAFGADRRRQNQLQLGRWFVLRYTYAQIRYHRVEVIDEIRQALELADQR